MEARKQKSPWNLTFLFGSAQCHQSAINPLVLAMVLISVKCIYFQERIFFFSFLNNFDSFTAETSHGIALCLIARLRELLDFSQLDWNALFYLSYSRKCLFLLHMEALQCLH